MARSYQDYYQALYDVAEAVSSSLELPEVLHQIVRSVTAATGFKACSLRLLAPDGNRLQQAAAHGLTQVYMAKGPVNLVDSPLDCMVLAGGVVQLEDAVNDWRWQYPEEAEREGICSVLSVPLRVKNRTLGVLRTYTADRHHFDDDEVQFLQALANLGALAIENARRYERTHADYQNTLEALMGFPVTLASYHHAT